MKRIFAGILTLLMVVSMFALNASAEVYADNVIYLEDGSYIVIKVIESGIRSTGTKTGRATYDYYDSDGVLGWTAVLNGTFTYNGSSATCTSSSCSVTVLDTAWYTVSKSASKSSNSATAALTMGKKLLGVTITRVQVDMILSCDPNGNLS